MGDGRRRMEMGLPPRGSAGSAPQMIQVDLTDKQRIVCECGCNLFIPAIEAYTVPAVVSPTGKESIAQRPILVCMECKKAMKWNPIGTEKEGT